MKYDVASFLSWWKVCECNSNASLQLDISYLIDVWLSEDHMKQTPQRHMFRKDWTMLSNVINYSTLDNEHNREDLSIQSRKSTNMHLFAITMIELGEV